MRFSSDNEKIKHIYGNYNLWSWLRYWHIDSADYTTLLLIDKAYYDYDYARPEKKWSAKRNAPRNDDELKELLRHLGIEENKPENDAERLQREVMEEEILKKRKIIEPRADCL